MKLEPEPAVFASFSAFYPYYLGEHHDRRCRRLHFIGTALALTTAAFALVTGQATALIGVPVFGYGFAWFGHVFFERNRPATFRAPLYSLLGDFRMFGEILSGRIPF